jgi:hypothetical protein
MGAKAVIGFNGEILLRDVRGGGKDNMSATDKLLISLN